MSVDVVLTSIASSILACHIFQAKPVSIYWICLSLSVWVIYLIDHLSDILFLGSLPNVEKQKFFRTHSKPIIFGLAVLIVILSLTLIFAPLKLILYGITGAMGVALYLLLNPLQNKKNIYLFPRELFASAFYVFGTWGFPFLISPYHFCIESSLLIIGFWLLTFSNMLIFAYFDFESDKKQNVLSIAVKWGRSLSQQLCQFFILLAFILNCIVLWISVDYYIPAAIEITMCLVLLTIITRPNSFKSKEKYGIIADFCFLLPLILLAFN